MLPWQHVVFSVKHYMNGSAATCNKPPSGLVKMLPLFKIRLVFMQPGSDLQRVLFKKLLDLFLSDHDILAAAILQPHH